MSQQLTKEFVEAYDTLADSIFRHIYYRLFNRELAKDLMQETFTRTWVYMRKGKDVKNLKSFLYRVANNLVIDEYRKRKEVSLDVLRLSGFDAENHDKEKIIIDVENSNALKVVSQLEPHYREVILLRYVDDLSIKEIAEIIDQTENVVSVRINRGIKELRKLLKT